MTRYLCCECGRPVPVERTYDPRTQQTTVELLQHDDCNPRLLAFFNPASQHFPPFGR